MILRQQIIDKYNCRCYNDKLFVEVFNSQKPFARFFCVVFYCKRKRVDIYGQSKSEREI